MGIILPATRDKRQERADMKKGLPFIREHRTYCGRQYMTVDLFQHTSEQDEASRKRRKRKEQVSAPKQRNLNDKRARRYLGQLLNTNFGAGDIHMVLSFKPGQVPESREAADKLVTNYLRRVDWRRKKLGMEPMKRVVIAEGGDISPRTGRATRFHYHIVLSGGISREDLELMWNTKRINWKKLDAGGEQARRYREELGKTLIGWANSKSLQPGENGLEQLANYLSKDPKGKRRWSASKNLEKPVRTTNDSKYTCRAFEKRCTSGEIYTRAFWEKKYPGWTLAGSEQFAVEAEAPDDFNNWRIFAKLRRRE